VHFHVVFTIRNIWEYGRQGSRLLASSAEDINKVVDAGAVVEPSCQLQRADQEGCYHSYRRASYGYLFREYLWGRLYFEFRCLSSSLAYLWRESSLATRTLATLTPVILPNTWHVSPKQRNWKYCGPTHYEVCLFKSPCFWVSLGDFKISDFR